MSLLYPSARHPLLERYLIAQLDAAGFNAGTSTELDLFAEMPYVRVEVIPGGGGDSIVTRTSVVDVESFAATRAGMWELADGAEVILLRLRSLGVVDWVAVHSSPGYVNYGNPKIFRAVATYEITTRTQPH